MLSVDLVIRCHAILLHKSEPLNLLETERILSSKRERLDNAFS